MNTKKAATLLVFLLVSAVLITISIRGNSEAPSGEFLAQALAHQEELCGRSLDVAYALSIDNKHQSDCRYVRSPDTLFLERRSELRDSRFRLDRNSKESRQVMIRKDGGQSEGIIDDKFAGDLGNRVIPDVVLFPLDVGTLSELVSRGKVQADKQDIDDSSCWLIEIPSKYTPDEVYRVWVDPTIGFCPRRIEILRANRLPQTIDFLLYKDLGNGIWFPTEIRNNYQFVSDNTDRMVEVVMKVNKVDIDQTISKSELDVVFPKGCHVYNKITNAEYVQP